MIVDNSHKELISLEDEVNFLKLYLQLEQLRLGHTFKFEIICAQNVDAANISISSMLLQPVVENAVIHGLPMRAENKMLTIHFDKFEDMLRCIIVDNGIGRQKAGNYLKKHGLSMGVNNITERLQLVYAKENIRWKPIEFSDAFPDAEYPGTKVVFYIPIFQIT
jgi:LytS/YehU family sensor histidine kinase